MPLVRVPPEAVSALYFQAAEKYNRPETCPHERRRLYWQASGVFEAVKALGFEVGIMLVEADTKAMEQYGEDAEMCGGFLIGRDEQ